MTMIPSQKNQDETNQVKILLVDDLSDNLLALEGLLRRDDVEIFKARSGAEALELMISHEFALALIDVQMPGMSGFELAELMRGAKKTKNIPIIFVTATAKDQYFSFKGYESGAVDFLPKPLDTHAVKSKVNVFIEQYLQKKELNNQLNARKEAEDRLQLAYEEMEKRVQERTAQLETQANRLRVLADQIVTTEQRERKRIAAILHDQLQQILVASTFQLAEASRSIENQEFEKVADYLDRGKDFLSQAIRSARSLTTELRPPVLYEDGLITAFEWLARKFKEEHDLEVLLNMEEAGAPLSDSIKIMIFESVKELLFNVVKHAEVKQARLTFKSFFNHVLYICVEDKGVGLEASQKGKVFSENEGGLGLFGMRERLKLLNAEFDISSPPSEGTKIEIRIPIEPFVLKEKLELSQKTNKRSTHVPTSVGNKKIKILLVDDHQIVREGIVNLLKANPLFQVVAQAENGLDAIEKTASFLPDVIIMDINMPKLSGIEATRLIKRDFPQIKIIGLSVQDENDIADSMKKAGALMLLNKTDAPEVLIETILNCMKN